MDNFSSFFSSERLLDVCALLHGARDLFFSEEEEDEDPLASPEVTLTIHDDWSISNEETSGIPRYDSEDEYPEEDYDRGSEETEYSEDEPSTGPEDDDSTFRRIDYRTYFEENSFTDSEDQIVPSKPAKSCPSPRPESSEKNSEKEEEGDTKKEIAARRTPISSEGNEDIGNRSQGPQPP